MWALPVAYFTLLDLGLCNSALLYMTLIIVGWYVQQEKVLFLIYRSQKSKLQKYDNEVTMLLSCLWKVCIVESVCQGVEESVCQGVEKGELGLFLTPVLMLWGDGHFEGHAWR